ncbi:MAG: hypothetical protein WAM42_13015 [Candidatus Nitrosopolaris sp.]
MMRHLRTLELVMIGLAAVMLLAVLAVAADSDFLRKIKVSPASLPSTVQFRLAGVVF